MFFDLLKYLIPDRYLFNITNNDKKQNHNLPYLSHLSKYKTDNLSVKYFKNYK
jgi:hypothetical protein